MLTCSHTMTSRYIAYFAGALACIGIAGCMSTPTHALTAEPRSIIASIGNSGIVTFEKPSDPAASRTSGGIFMGDPEIGELSIPITIVQSLQGTPDSDAQMLSSTVSVSVYGVSPPTLAEYYLRVRSLSDSAEFSGLLLGAGASGGFFDGESLLELPPAKIDRNERSLRTCLIDLVLRPSYIARLESMDQFRIHAQIQDRYLSLQTLLERNKANRISRTAWDDFTQFISAQWAQANLSVPTGPVLSPGTSTAVPPRVDPTQPRPEWVKDDTQWRDLTDRISKARTDLESTFEKSTSLKTRGSNAVRMITFMSSKDYRDKRLKNSIPIYNVNAFPLSSVQTEYLFGKKMSRLYYVVGISIQNTAEDQLDKYVNSGMIRVSGQALIRPEGSDASTWFTVPVSVSPQSREHVYTVLDDEEVDEPRSIVFRTLEFVGTLATAFVTGFNGSEEAIRGLGIATGIGIPEGKKFWPDRWPGYKRNVVNYAMPNLIKIGKGSSSPTYFLFFSKNRLEGMVMDSQLFRENRQGLSGYLTMNDESVTSAAVNVATLSFDSIEIPFEYSADESLLKGGASTQNAVTRAIFDASIAAAGQVSAATQRVRKAQDSVNARKSLATAQPELTADLERLAADAQKIELPPEVRPLLEGFPRAIADVRVYLPRLLAANPSTVSRDLDDASRALASTLNAVRSARSKMVETWKITAESPPNDDQKAILQAVDALSAAVERTLAKVESLAPTARTLAIGPVSPDEELAKAEEELKQAQAASAKAESLLKSYVAPPAPTSPPETPQK